MGQKTILESSAKPGGPSGSSHVVRNSVLNVASRLTSALVNLVTVYVLARRLGKDELGLYYTVFAILLAVQVVLEAGIATVVTYRIVQSPGRWRSIVAEANGLLLVVIAASLCAIGVIGLIWHYRTAGAVPLSLFAVTALACAMVQVERFTTAVFRSSERFGWENFTLVLQGVLFAALAALLLRSGDGPTTVMAMFAASHAVAAGVLVAALRRRAPFPGIQLDFGVLKSWLSQSVPLGLGDVVRRLTWQLDTILLGLLQPASVVALYAIAYWPLVPLNWVPLAIMTAMFPSLTRMGGLDRKALASAFSASIRVLWVTSLPVAVVIFTGADTVVSILAGPSYREAVEPMRILIWITSLSFLSIQWRFFLTAVAKQRSYGRIVLAVFLAEAGIEVALIPTWGWLGACAGSLTGELLFVVAGLVHCRRLGFGKVEWRAILASSLAALGMGALLWGLRGSPLAVFALGAALSTVAYAALCVAFGALGPRELRAAIGVFRRLKPTSVRVCD